MRINFNKEHSFSYKHTLKVPKELCKKNHMHDKADWMSNYQQIKEPLLEYLNHNSIKFSSYSDSNNMTLYLLNTTDEDVLSLILSFDNLTILKQSPSSRYSKRSS